MPLIFRAMTRNLEGKPVAGTSARSLGVRVPPDGAADIAPDAAGNVHPETGGMSVAPAWRKLPSYRIPKRLAPLAPDACGKNEDACFRLGEGEFIRSVVTAELMLRPDRPSHGLIEPAVLMSLVNFQAALAATQDQWQIDES
jgi:hypothetical protein